MIAPAVLLAQLIATLAAPSVIECLLTGTASVVERVSAEQAPQTFAASTSYSTASASSYHHASSSANIADAADAAPASSYAKRTPSPATNTRGRIMHEHGAGDAARIRLGGERRRIRGSSVDSSESEDLSSSHPRPIDWALVARLIDDPESLELVWSSSIRRDASGGSGGSGARDDGANVGKRRQTSSENRRRTLLVQRGGGDGGDGGIGSDDAATTTSLDDDVSTRVRRPSAAGWAWWMTKQHGTGVLRVDGASRHARMQRMRDRLKGTREGEVLSCIHSGACEGEDGREGGGEEGLSLIHI